MTVDKLLLELFEELLKTTSAVEQMFKGTFKALLLLARLSLKLTSENLFRLVFYSPDLTKTTSPYKKEKVENVYKRSLGDPWATRPF